MRVREHGWARIELSRERKEGRKGRKCPSPLRTHSTPRHVTPHYTPHYTTEIEVDLQENGAARNAIKLAKGTAGSMTFSFAFVLEGHSEVRQSIYLSIYLNLNLSFSLSSSYLGSISSNFGQPVQEELPEQLLASFGVHKAEMKALQIANARDTEKSTTTETLTG